LLGKLHKFDHDLPCQQFLQQEMWRIRIKLAEMLVKGVTVLELKTSILPGHSTVEDFWDQASTMSTENSDGDSEKKSLDEDMHGIGDESEAESGDGDEHSIEGEELSTGNHSIVGEQGLDQYQVPIGNDISMMDDVDKDLGSDADAEGEVKE
ncbi:hypothetical protein H0H87_000824, partial [Tephrocybe sp. NHM501043]